MSDEKKKKPLWLKILIGIGVLIVIGAIGKAVNPKGGGGQTAAPSSPAATSSQGSPTPAPAEKAIVITARKLYEDYRSNEIASDEKYKDKILDITGNVLQIKKDILDDLFVLLDAGNPIMGVQAYFGDRHKSKLANLKKGDRVVIRCRGAGLMGNAIVKGCSF